MTARVGIASVLRRYAVGAAAVLLAACTPGTDEDLALLNVYRDQDAPIGAIASFAPDRFLGRWHEVARFPVAFEAGCAGAIADYTARPDGLIGVRNSCLDASGAVTRQIEGTARVVGPGRLKVSFPSVPFVEADYWVLWVDQDYRTAVVGAPDGRAGWILNRTPDISPDRMVAAREILDFNGYDLSRLKVLSP